MRILEILDSRSNRNTLAEILGFEGHDMSTADNLETGLRMAKSEPFDVVFFDLDLESKEGQKGFGLLKDVCYYSPTFILITKKRVDIESYKEKGISSVLYTPIDLNGLLITLKSVEPVELVEPHESYTYDYPRPAVTVDCVVFCYDENRDLSVLLIERNGEPYKGCWAFPGGFLEMDETTVEAASRELQEETGLVIPAWSGCLKELGCYSAVDRDPRGRVITIAYYAIIDKTEVKGSDDAHDARWFPLSQIPALAFDHDKILSDALDIIASIL